MTNQFSLISFASIIGAFLPTRWERIGLSCPWSPAQWNMISKEVHLAPCSQAKSNPWIKKYEENTLKLLLVICCPRLPHLQDIPLPYLTFNHTLHPSSSCWIVSIKHKEIVASLHKLLFFSFSTQMISYLMASFPNSRESTSLHTVTCCVLCSSSLTYFFGVGCHLCPTLGSMNRMNTCWRARVHFVTCLLVTVIDQCFCFTHIKSSIPQKIVIYV